MTHYHYEFVKTLTSQQVHDIENLYRDAHWWDEHYDQDWLYDLPQKSTLYLIVLSDEKVIGMGRILSDGMSDGYIQDIAVLSTYRKQGIGGKIIQNLIAKAKEQGIDWIALIGEPNTQSFYEKLGFEVMPKYIPMIYKG